MFLRKSFSFHSELKFCAAKQKWRLMITSLCNKQTEMGKKWQIRVISSMLKMKPSSVFKATDESDWLVII